MPPLLRWDWTCRLWLQFGQSKAFRHHLKSFTVSEKSLCGCQAWCRSCSKPQGTAAHGLLKAAFSRFEHYIDGSAWGSHIFFNTTCLKTDLHPQNWQGLEVQIPVVGCAVYTSFISLVLGYVIRRVCLSQSLSFTWIFIFICNLFCPAISSEVALIMKFSMNQWV